MKQKIVLLFLVVIIAKSNFAQKTSIGISGGISLANIHVKSEDFSTTSKSKPGFTGGIYLVTPVATNFAFLPAINFVQKGMIPKDLDAGEKEKVTLNYIEVPLNFAYATRGFIIGAGPTFSLGLSGTDKYSSDTQPEEKTKLNFGNGEDDDIKLFEAGANVFTGYQFTNGFMITANYNFGLSNLIPGADSEDGKAINNYFGFRLAYTFHRK